MEAAATADNHCVAAVTHSTYLRMLLTVFLNKPLATANSITVMNGSISVLDVDLSGKTRIAGPRSKLFNGLLSLAPSDFELKVPVADVVRINEIRHLQGLN